MLEYNFNFVKKNKIAIGSVLIIFCGLISFYLIILNWNVECQNLENIIIIPKGASASFVGDLLKENECIEDANVFKLALIMTNKTRKIRPGRYDFKGIASIGQLVINITSQPGDIIKVTLVEGWEVRQMADELHAKLKIDVDKFIRLTKDVSFIREMEINAVSLEGFLFPDTYFLLKYYTEEEILEIFINLFKHNYQKLVDKHGFKSHFEMEEIIVLASIIQGEAMYVDEMSIISSVYHNRLKKSMLLQADPTIQYVMSGKPRRLFNKDLEVDSPYNTYKHKGLPPGPINNPGIEAVQAAMAPKETDYLYFVSNGEGRHVFSRTVEEHNFAKKQLRRKLKNNKN